MKGKPFFLILCLSVVGLFGCTKSDRSILAIGPTAPQPTPTPAPPTILIVPPAPPTYTPPQQPIQPHLTPANPTGPQVIIINNPAAPVPVNTDSPAPNSNTSQPPVSQQPPTNTNNSNIPQSPAPAPPTLSFIASPTSVHQNETVGLTWSAANAFNCNSAGGWPNDMWSDDKNLFGTNSIAYISPNQTTEYVMSCSGPGGIVTAKQTVTRIP